VFPRIAVKSKPGSYTVRELREKVLDEKVIQRTEEIVDEKTGEPKLRTVEYVEKVIETEVRYFARLSSLFLLVANMNVVWI
jgi:hypothetical protein